MQNIFLESYTVSDCLTFQGVSKHHEAFRTEKEWNGRAIVHLVLSMLHFIPVLSYALEALASATLSTPSPSSLLPLKAEQVTLLKGVIFGTTNQYGSEKQSCTVQALSFLATLFKNQTINPSLIDESIKEGSQTFRLLADKATETRRKVAQTFLEKQGVTKETVKGFFEKNPQEPTLLALTTFGQTNRLNEWQMQVLSQNLSGQALTAKEASGHFKQQMNFLHDYSAPLPQAEVAARAYFKDTLIGPLELETKALSGAILTCNGMTLAIALVKTETSTSYMIYDSHGNGAKHGGNSAAYVQILDSSDEAADYLSKTFSYTIDGTNQIESLLAEPK